MRVRVSVCSVIDFETLILNLYEYMIEYSLISRKKTSLLEKKEMNVQLLFRKGNEVMLSIY
jgi:hypothetical protein